MRAVKCLVILMALAYCVEGRERLGKIFKRQAREREFKAIQNPSSGVVPQSVVLNSFTQPQEQSQLAATPRQSSQINVPLTRQAVQQPYQQPAPISQPAQYQQAQPQPIQQSQYQPQPQPIQQSQYQQPQPQPIQQSQYQQPQPQPIQQSQYQQPQPQQVQQPYQQPQVPQIPYRPAPQQAVQQPAPYNPLAQTLSQATIPYSQPIAIRETPGYILSRLPSNASLIRPYITDGFSCAGRAYGYYADVINECQIFHVCFPLKSVFNNDPAVPDVTYDFSFICNEFTRFSQDSMTCAWQFEAVPCEYSEQLYALNDNFFKITTPAPVPAPGPGGYSPAPLPGSIPLPQGGYNP